MAPPALPLNRHRSSLEGIIDFSSRPSLSADGRAYATRRFHQVINHFDNDDMKQNDDKYDRIKLIRFTYEYSISEESKCNLIIALFESLNLSPSAHEDIDFQDSTYRAELQADLHEFADYLVDNFFLPREICRFLYLTKSAQRMPHQMDRAVQPSPLLP
ncbi:uncharacterized protein NECHADRAFT_82207 [Fusarium vanettenii 77-13-4]|uniref:Uncharacterized protein n=1 Tax=Fusarium vanettenii (strain ATCC MYA-4622 / CBS 123669 / FGSC 9596 / NRRL 45880 / 77-13-4) TaxID=660122 RepID=C7ZJR5_FUSV7|nr:uncharacterized protein NECHADRAFT_82207 [Fusarium vanettenii 77-13-4]EEU35786.1 hypothetical protein NECHADRAFT_82207 [Fusarium vanettenii 77-13-4]